MENMVPVSAIESAADALRRQGWWAADRVLDERLTAALRAELHQLIEEDRLHRAGIGRETDFQIDRDIRRDRVFWLTRRRPIQRRFLERMEALRWSLNRELFLALFEFEAHFAHYPPGGFYRRHLDSFRGAANRIVSMVAYLNNGWRPADGGELLLYRENTDQVIARIEPRAGTMVLFMSEEIPHEVLPARTDRTSIAGWFRLNGSIGGQIDPPR